MSEAGTVAAVKNVVLVHGAFADGSGWQGVYQTLTRDGYTVSVVQHPTISLADDVAYTRRAIAALNGPVILVGHSYGGAVITEAGTDPLVAGLVYIAAFAPDAGESVGTLIANPAPGAPVPPIVPSRDGFLFVDPTKFPEAFAADVDRETVHGHFPGAVGPRRSQRHDRSASLEEQAELVPGRHRRQDDSPGCAARDGRPRRRDDGRGQRESCHLRVEASARGVADRHGGDERRRSGASGGGRITKSGV